MKILVISNLFPPRYLGGYEILCEQVCRELGARGPKVVVLTSDHGVEEKPLSGSAAKRPSCLDRSTDDVIQDRNGRLQTEAIHRLLKLYVPFDKPAGLMRGRRQKIGRLNYATTMGLIGRERPDVIFIWSQLRLTLGAARAAEDSGIPSVYTFNDEHIAGYRAASPSFSPKGLLRYIADHSLFADITLNRLRMERVTCISHLLKQRLIEKGVTIEDARVIHQGIPIEKFPLKEKPGELHTPVRVLYVGQLHDYKGVHTLVEAANIVASDAINPTTLRVTIIGDGPEDYKRQIRDTAAAGRAQIDFAGKLAHELLSEAYQRHDIFVFPSMWKEPFGLTHLEAMASGVPVACSNISSMPEVAGDAAVLFDPYDEETIEDALRHILTNNERLRDSARRGLGRSHKLTWAKTAAQTLDVIQRAAKEVC